MKPENVEVIATIDTGRAHRVVIERAPDRGGVFIYGERKDEADAWQRRGFTIIPAFALSAFVNAVTDALDRNEADR